MKTLYRVIFFLAAFIMNACYGDDMSNLQQRSKFGTLTPGSSQQKVNFQLPCLMNDEGYPDPGNYTVQFNVNDPNVLAFSGDFVRPRAEIIWSVGGNSVRRVIDCTDGVSITGTAEGIAVNVFDESNITFSSVVPYTVSLQVGKGSRPSIQQPPFYSLNIETVDVDSSVDVAIPKDIGAVSAAVVVVPTTIGTAIGQYDIRVSQLAGATIRKSYDPRQEFWVPLVGGVDAIRLRTGPAAPASEFQITLGIDG